MDEYSKHYGFSPGVVTGKPLQLFGSPGREEATGRGVMYVLEEALKDQGRSMQGLRVALQGFGNVGSHAARLIAEQGAKIVAVADHLGGVSNPDGLDVSALFDHAREKRTVDGFVGGDSFAGEEVLTWDCDVLIPAALEDVITAENARDVRAGLVIEAANGPTTPEADEILLERGITVVPDILANAGGVTVSYFERARRRRAREDHAAFLRRRSRRGQREAGRPSHRGLRPRHSPRRPGRAGASAHPRRHPVGLARSGSTPSCVVSDRAAPRLSTPPESTSGPASRRAASRGSRTAPKPSMKARAVRVHGGASE